MKKGTKIALGVALCCIGLGLLLFAFAMSMFGPDGLSFDSLRSGSVDTTNPVVKTMRISEPFSNIEMEDVECNLFILPSADGNCSMEYTDSDVYIHKVEVKGDTLTISREETGSWTDHIFMVWGESRYVKVYLPAGTYDKLAMATVSGNIQVDGAFTFSSAAIASTSGNAEFSAQIEDAISISTTSGNIEIGSANPQKMSLSAVSGDITLRSTEPGDLSTSTTSGDITLRDVMVSGHMELDTSSGDIELNGVDSGTADCSTGSGDISGEILTVKDFRADSGSGDIRVPQADPNAGTWELSTGSGDIELTVTN